MQENYEDGTKGEIKLIEWKDLTEEIKKSLNKEKVKSVTITKTARLSGGKILKLEEENQSLLDEIAEIHSREEVHPFANCTEPRIKK